MTISGTNFASGATVTFGGTSATSVVVVSSTTITATTPAHAAGVVNVVVTNNNGQSGTLTNGYTYFTRLQRANLYLTDLGHDEWRNSGDDQWNELCVGCDCDVWGNSGDQRRRGQQYYDHRYHSRTGSRSCECSSNEQQRPERDSDQRLHLYRVSSANLCPRPRARRVAELQ